MVTRCIRWLWFLGVHLAAVQASLLAAAAEPSPLTINPSERLVVVSPHPDDETLGAAGLIQNVLEHGGSVRVVLVTAGDGYVEAVVRETGRPRPRPAQYVAYGEQRLGEARRALRELGGDSIRAEHLLGFPDGGLDGLLQAHWSHVHPERSATTEAVKPPYPEAQYSTALYDGEDLRAALIRCFQDVRPTIVAFPDPLDIHPDHSATGLFTLLAVKEAAHAPAGKGMPMPRLLAYLIHWPDWPKGWNVAAPSADSEASSLEVPPDLPTRGLDGVVLELTAEETAAKGRALSAYVTQEREMGSFLRAFVRRSEPFTVFTRAELDHIRELARRVTDPTPARGLELLHPGPNSSGERRP